MTSRSMYSVAAMGLLACVGMAVVLLFSLKQVAANSPAQIARQVHAKFERSLDPDAPTMELTLAVEGDESAPSARAPRRGRLALTPSVAVSRNLGSVERLLTRAAEEVIRKLESKGPITLECVARMPDGTEHVVVLDRNLRRLSVPVTTGDGDAE